MPDIAATELEIDILGSSRHLGVAAGKVTLEIWRKVPDMVLRGIDPRDLSRIRDHSGYKFMKDGGVKFRVGQNIRVSYGAGRVGRNSLNAVIEAHNGKIERMALERKALANTRAVNAGMFTVAELVASMRKAAPKRENVKKAVIAGIILGGVVVASTILGPEIGAKVPSYMLGAGPAVIKCMAFAADIAAQVAEHGPDVAEAFSNGVSLAAEKVSALTSTGAAYVRDTISPALSWLSAQRGEIISAAKGALEIVSQVWTEVRPTSVSDGVTKAFGLVGGIVAFMQGVDYLKEKFFGKKPEEKAVVHHHHHHHHRVPTSQDAKAEAERAAEMAAENVENGPPEI